MNRGTAVGLSVLAGALGALQLLVVGFVALIASIDTFGDGGNFGVDGDLPALRASCEDGDMLACDDLYFGSPVGSDDEAFGETCGNRNDPAPGSCVATHGATFDPANPGVLATVDDYGDDPELDVLWDGCEAGDLLDCDDLYFQSPIDSGYEAYGATCGNREDDRNRQGRCQDSAP